MRYTLRGIGSVGEATISNRMATLLSPWAIICVGAVSGRPDQHASDKLAVPYGVLAKALSAPGRTALGRPRPC